MKAKSLKYVVTKFGITNNVNCPKVRHIRSVCFCETCKYLRIFAGDGVRCLFGCGDITRRCKGDAVIEVSLRPHHTTE